MIKTVFVYNATTLFDFYVFHLSRKDKIRWVYYLVSLIFIVLGGVILILFFNVFYALIIIFAALLMFLMFKTRVKIVAKKKVKNTRMKKPSEIIFKDEGIQQNAEDGSYLYEWQVIKEVDETIKYFYFYVSSTSALIVIKDALSHDDYNSLVNLIKERHLSYYRYKRI